MTNSWIFQVKRFFRSRYSYILGIDIGTNAIRMVELDLRGNAPMLKNCFIGNLLPLSEGDPAFIGTRSEEINRLVQINGIVARCAFVSVGGRNIYTREIVFPQLTERELPEAVRWEMEKYVPYDAAGYYHDFSVIHDGNDEGLRVFLGAASKTYVDTLMAIFAKTSIRVLAIEGDTIALGRILKTKTHSVLVNIGKESSEVIFYRGGAPVIVRNVSFGSNRLAAMQAERIEGVKCGLADSLRHSVEAFAEELARNIEYHMRQNSIVITGIYLSGERLGFDCISDELTRRLKLPIQLIPVLDDCVVSSSFDTQYLHDILPQVAVAMGLALRGLHQ